jgi:hypothetical protein
MYRPDEVVGFCHAHQQRHRRRTAETKAETGEARRLKQSLAFTIFGNTNHLEMSHDLSSRRSPRACPADFRLENCRKRFINNGNAWRTGVVLRTEVPARNHGDA